MEALLSEGIPEGGDGTFDPARSDRDRLSAPGWDVAYAVTDNGRARLASIGVDCSDAGWRPLVRYCVDWSEQRHHLAGALGARLLSRFEARRWVRRQSGTRALTVTEAGARELGSTLGLDVTDVLVAHQREDPR